MQVQDKDFAEETAVQITGAVENWLYFASGEEMLSTVLGRALGSGAVGKGWPSPFTQ